MQNVEPDRLVRLRQRNAVGITGFLLAWLALMAPLARWGLPSRENDDLLFGGAPAWSAARFRAAEALAQRRARDAGADTDLNPIRDRSQAIVLTADEAGRAEILRRYRLFSRQPDEMITFMALQRMNPRTLDLDPKLYQYGGAYLYLVGAVESVAALLGYTRITSDVGVYLEHPELFGRFYFVSRLMTLAFGALALLAVYRLARRIGGRPGGWIAMLVTAATPVFITTALEAKPHLPSVCMVLWATEFAWRFATSTCRRDALRMGLAAGAAAGAVLTGFAAALLWPALALVRRGRGGGGDLAWSALLAMMLYACTNPFLIVSAISGKAAATSNLSNSIAMYVEQMSRAAEGALRVAELLVEAGGWAVFIALIAAVMLSRRGWRHSLLLGVAPLGMLSLCVFLAAGKPAEFARFLLLPTITLMIALGGCLGLMAAPRRGRIALLAAGTLACVATSGGWAYVVSFARDAAGRSESRRQAGEAICNSRRADSVAVVQEPAPYATPPLDFTMMRLVLLPLREPAAPRDLPRLLVMTADDLDATRGWWRDHYELVTVFPSAQQTRPFSPITWADKPVFLFERRGSEGEAQAGYR